MKRHTLQLVASLAITLAACTDFKNTTQPQTQAEKANAEVVKQLIKEEQAFSQLSADSGFKKAFLNYLANDGVLLRSGRFPVEGRENYLPFYQAVQDEGLQLTWEPFEGTVAASGDLGFVYGIYELKVKQSGEVLKGSYVTIWKKEDGKWKVALDTGNPGLGPDSTRSK